MRFTPLAPGHVVRALSDQGAECRGSVNLADNADLFIEMSDRDCSRAERALFLRRTSSRGGDPPWSIAYLPQAVRHVAAEEVASPGLSTASDSVVKVRPRSRPFEDRRHRSSHRERLPRFARTRTLSSPGCIRPRDRATPRRWRPARGPPQI